MNPWPPPQDAENTLGDSVSCVYSDFNSNSVGATIGSTNTVGLITLFIIGVPKIDIYTSTLGTQTNYVVLEWPTWPTLTNFFLLEFSTNSDMTWSAPSIPGGISNAYPYGGFVRYQFPATSAASPGYFRLRVSPPGQ